MRNIRTQVDSELDSLSINTNAEVATFRALPAQSGNMKTVIDNIKTTLGLSFVSRKRVRHDALRLLRNGQL